jgi:hypothetical protein
MDFKQIESITDAIAGAVASVDEIRGKTTVDAGLDEGPRHL